MTILKLRTALFGAITLFTAIAPVFAQVLTPDPDSSFNATSYIMLNENKKFTPQDQAFQADGKILVSGYGKTTATSPDFDIVVYRLNADGTRDAGFGVNGMWKYDISGTQEACEDVAVTADQKILLLVNENHRVFLIRLLPDGNFDPDFGLEGLKLTDAKPTELMHEMIIQPDGKIVMVGTDYNQAQIGKGVIRRFNADGTPDAGFAANGYQTVTIDPTKHFELSDVALQPDGKIIATGEYGNAASSGFPVVRLNADGSFDTGFNDDGIYFKLLGSAARTALAQDITLQPDGKIVVCGNSPKSTNNTEVNLTVMRLRADGTTESTFGNFGVARVVYSAFTAGTQVLIQPDGKLLLGGYFYTSDTSTAVSFTRLKENGSLDPTFGFGNGKYAHIFGAPEFPVEVLSGFQLDENQKIVETVWQNNTVNLVATQSAQCYVSRYISDFTVGEHTAAYQIKSAKIWPNIITNQQITLEYSLDETAEITVSLFDQTGRYVCNLIPAAQQYPGIQTTQLEIPAEVPAGTYRVVIAGDYDYQTLPLVKIQ